MKKSGELLGILHQTALDAVKKKMWEIGEDFELAYWQVGLKTTMREMDSNFEKPLKTHVIETDDVL